LKAAELKVIGTGTQLRQGLTSTTDCRIPAIPDGVVAQRAGLGAWLFIDSGQVVHTQVPLPQLQSITALWPVLNYTAA